MESKRGSQRYFINYFIYEFMYHRNSIFVFLRRQEHHITDSIARIFTIRILFSVITDTVLPKVKVDNAQRVIFFDLPKRKDHFNARLWCMRENFKLPLLGRNVCLLLRRLYWTRNQNALTI